MVVTPLLRGLFGIEVDALKHEVSVTPHLPAQWDHAEVNRLHVGDAVVDLKFVRDGGHLHIALTQVSGPRIALAGGTGTEKSIPLPAIEVGIEHGLPLRGARTARMKVLSERLDERSITLELEGVAGTTSGLTLRRNVAQRVIADGAILTGDRLRVEFTGTTGYVTKIITLRW
jgi:hypothetical protein